MVDINRLLIAKYDKQFEYFLEAIALISDPTECRKIVDQFWQKEPNRNELADAYRGLFKRDTLIRVILSIPREKYSLNTGINIGILEMIITKLAEQNLIVRYFSESWEVHKGVKSIWESGNLPYYVLGLPHVAQNMVNAVAAINVKNQLGDIRCGSGVILHSKASGVGLVLTNRHVVEGKQIQEVLVSGQIIERTSEPILCEKADLAKFNIKLNTKNPRVNLAFQANVLDEVVAIGFPAIPNASQQSAFAHRGEINGAIETRDGQSFLAISCHVSPGNSGGPIFNKYGYCAGLVTETGTAKYASDSGMDDGYAVAYHMAIPVSVLIDFVSEKSGPTVFHLTKP